MGDAQVLERDRKLFRLHSATFVGGIVGLVCTILFAMAFKPWVFPWLLVGSSSALLLSGIVAVKIKRTLLTKRAEFDDPGLDAYGEDGDGLNMAGLITGDAWPWFTNTNATWGVLIVGAVFTAGSLYVLYASLSWPD